LNEVVKDVIHDDLKCTYSPALEQEKIVVDLLPYNQVYKIQTWVASEERNILMSLTGVQRVISKVKEINVLLC